MNALELSASIRDHYFTRWEEVSRSVAQNREMHLVSTFSRKGSEQSLFHRGLCTVLSYTGYLLTVQCYHVGDTVVKPFYANIKDKG